jgi:uncharacterized protein YndB with AHSA1/START domain
MPGTLARGSSGGYGFHVRRKPRLDHPAERLRQQATGYWNLLARADRLTQEHTAGPAKEGETMKIAIETRISAPIAVVWECWTNPEDITQWNAASDDWHTTRATVDLREGGRFSSRMEAKDGSSGFDFAGDYTRVVPLQLIEARFGDRVMSVEFTDQAGIVMVRETFDAEEQNSAELQRQGWQAILDNFARHVESKQANPGSRI